MKKCTVLLGVILLGVLLGCQDKNKSSVRTEKNHELSPVLVYNFDELNQLLHQDDNKLHVVNFWATWCAPCVEELPYFMELKKNTSVDLLLVSLDFPSMVDTHLVPFIAKNSIQARVVLLDDPDGNRWIPKVDPDWEGAIPATLIYKNNRRAFYAQPFKSYRELENEVEKFN